MRLLRTLLSRELFLLGLRDLRAHKLRSFLTALGIIFGVGAVICMLSIGEGASAKQLETIRLLGSQNIILRSVEPPLPQEASRSSDQIRKFGLTRLDVERLRALPFVEEIALMRDVANSLANGARRFEGTVLGTSPNYFDVVNITISRGRRLFQVDDDHAAKVCVIGAEIARVLFPQQDPLGCTLTVLSQSTGAVPYQVVGVVSDVVTAGTPEKGTSSRDINRDVYIPLGTSELRYGDLKVKRAAGQRESKLVELSDLYVHVDREDNVLATAKLVQRTLEYGHKNQDFEVKVPLELLLQVQEARRNRNIVLGSIAGISLLVGGIGIMNIMLASVTERTREIGIRRALGAKQYHIVAQFLIETVILSVAGGVIGIGVGIGFAYLVSLYANWETIVSWWSVAVSFLVSALVGISFGLYPARAAARLDPIEALNSTVRAA